MSDHRDDHERRDLDSDPFAGGVIEARRALARGDVDPVDLVASALTRIETTNPDLGAFVATWGEDALAEAEALAGASDAEHRRHRDPLWGIPFADKDLTMREGRPTAFGSRAFAGFVAPTSDPAADGLTALGGISLGKTATPEFGLTCSSTAAIGPVTRVPWALDRDAGGSSGGAAVAVAAGALPFAPGSDGGGSIRIPAATVGIVGLKPSRGRLGIGSGLDAPAGLPVAGPLARSVADAAYLFDAMVAAGPPGAAVAAPPVTSARELLGSVGPWRIGVTSVSPWDDTTEIVIDSSAANAVDVAVATLASLGSAVEALEWRPAPYTEMFLTLWRALAAGIPLEDDALSAVEPLTAWLIGEGRSVPARELLGALAAASRFERDTIGAFDRFDAVLTPALAQSPRPHGWYDGADPIRNFFQQVQYTPFTSFVNVAGLPAVTVPVALGPAGEPVSVQLIGRPGAEPTILAIAGALERAVAATMAESALAVWRREQTL